MLVDVVTKFTHNGVELQSGKTIESDVVVLAAGCKYTEQPPFLKGLGTGTCSPRAEPLEGKG